jgi:hypothetical protein
MWEVAADPEAVEEAEEAEAAEAAEVAAEADPPEVDLPEDSHLPSQ